MEVPTLPIWQVGDLGEVTKGWDGNLTPPPAPPISPKRVEMGQGEERPLPKLLKLKPPKETDDPKLKKRSKNKNNINKEITNYRRIDEMFKVKSNENNQEMAELTTSKDGKMKVELKASSSKNDFQAKPAPQQVDHGRTFLKSQIWTQMMRKVFFLQITWEKVHARLVKILSLKQSLIFKKIVSILLA